MGIYSELLLYPHVLPLQKMMVNMAVARNFVHVKWLGKWNQRLNLRDPTSLVLSHTNHMCKSIDWCSYYSPVQKRSVPWGFNTWDLRKTESMASGSVAFCMSVKSGSPNKRGILQEKTSPHYTLCVLFKYIYIYVRSVRKSPGQTPPLVPHHFDTP